MGETTFRSAGVMTREIDLSQPQSRGPTGVPAGIVGAAEKGPAFVPLTFGSALDFAEVFGDALENETLERVREEMGDALFAMVNYARHLGVEPEDALRGAIDKFHSRFRHVEAAASGQEAKLRDLGIDRLNELWEEAKQLEN